MSLHLPRLSLFGCICLLPALLYAQTPPALPEPQPETRFDISPEIRSDAPPAAHTSGSPNPQQPLNISPEELLQNPELLHRALQSSVLLNNLEGVRLLLPLYRQLPPPHEEMLLILADAMIARADGHYKQAVSAYRQALSLEPDMPAVRLSLAQSLFENHENEAARDQFTRLRADSQLPPEIRRLVDHYLTALDQRNTWSFYGSFHYLRDDNINNAPANRTFRTAGGTWTFPEPESAEGLAYRLGGARDWLLGGHWSLRTAADASGKWYWNNRPYDDASARLTVGGAYKTARAEAALLPYFERRWFGNRAYLREAGLRAEWRYWLAPSHQLLLAGEWGQQKHDRRTFLDGPNRNVSATWLYIQNPRQYWILGTDYARKSARDRSDTYQRNSLRAGWTREWSYGLSTALTAEVGLRRYDGPDFLNIRRKDKEYAASLSVWHRRVHFWGITPRLVGTWQKSDSNHPLYRFQKSNLFIQIGKTF